MADWKIRDTDIIGEGPLKGKVYCSDLVCMVQLYSHFDWIKKAPGCGCYPFLPSETSKMVHYISGHRYRHNSDWLRTVRPF